jgi:hypothetical protein
VILSVVTIFRVDMSLLPSIECGRSLGHSLQIRRDVGVTPVRQLILWIGRRFRKR